MENDRLKQMLGPGPACPSIQRLAYYADGLLPVAELQADEAHISACPNCLMELELLRAFTTSAAENNRDWAIDDAAGWLRRREKEIFGEPSTVRKSWKKWLPAGRLRPAVGLAAILLAAGIGYVLNAPGAPVLPGTVGTGSEATRSLRVRALGPTGDLSAIPERLTWETVAGARRYHARVMEVDRHEIWSADATAAAVDLPADLRARITPARTLEWQVTALDGAGQPIAASDVQRFRLLK
jgi:anti-sigma factor RsiW